MRKIIVVITALLISVLGFSWVDSVTEVSVNVSLNPFNQLVQQLTEKESLLERKLVEINIFEKKLLPILFLGWLILFALILLNFYLDRYGRKRRQPANNSQLNFLPQSHFLEPRSLYKKGADRGDGGKCDLGKFGERIVEFTKKIPRKPTTECPTNRLLKIGTSFAGVRWTEEIYPEEDFLSRTKICKKKIRDVRHNLRKIIRAAPPFKKKAKVLWQEAHEISLVCASIINKHK